nr:B12-binding domain-containing protein [Desulfosarcinaceae bacterium]
MAVADIFTAVLAFDEAQAKSLTQAELDAGTDIETILNEGLIGAMDDVGKK